MIHPKFVKQLKTRVKRAIKNGAKLIYGDLSNKKNPNLIYPIFLTNVKKHMDIVTNEILGPLCPILKSRNFNEAINIANHGNYNIAGKKIDK